MHGGQAQFLPKPYPVRDLRKVVNDILVPGEALVRAPGSPNPEA